MKKDILKIIAAVLCCTAFFIIPTNAEETEVTFLTPTTIIGNMYLTDLSESITQQLTEHVETLKAQEYELKIQSIVDYADQFVGNPYVWGGASLTKGCDCSHFVWLVLRDTIGYDEGWLKSTYWTSRGTVVNSLSEAQAGDIIVYSGHVAIYDGKGYIVEALNPRRGIVHERKADCTKILGIRRFV